MELQGLFTAFSLRNRNIIAVAHNGAAGWKPHVSGFDGFHVSDQLTKVFFPDLLGS